MVGLGRMGGNMALRLLRGGHRVVAYDRNPDAVDALKAEGAVPAYSLEEVVSQMTPPRHIWLMVPAGAPVAATIEALAPLLDRGDALIDGGNSNYKDSAARARDLAERGLHFVDVGTSGGVWGLKNGYCLMVGGEEEIFRRLEPVLKTLAPVDGYGYMGPAGAGHFVKMIHNGIEYGLLQAYAEGFELLHASRYELDLRAIASLWQRGSVVRSWLLELTERALAEDPGLEQVRDYVEDSGEGRWTVQEAIDLDVPAVTLAYALFARFRSRQEQSFAAKLIAALRKEFGGHAVKPPAEGGPDAESERAGVD